MCVDNKLTILLTLKDRVAFTWRWMRYAEHIRCPFKIVIADGGADETVSAILSNKHNYPHVDYEYVRYSYDRTVIEYYHKVADALSRITTPYVMMVDNDDFFIVDGLTHSVEFLDSHADYSACGGPPIWFEVIPSENNGKWSGIYGRTTKYYDAYLSHPMEQNSALQRVQSSMSPYCISWYHVQRIEHIRKHWDILQNINPGDVIWMERMLACLIAAKGKVAVHTLPYYFKQANSPDSVGSAFLAEQGDLLKRMLRITWIQDYLKIIDAIANAVAGQDGMSKEKTLEDIKQIYETHIAEKLYYELAGRCSVASVTPSPGISNISDIMRKCLKIGRLVRSYYSTRRQAHAKESVSAAWVKHPALKPMLEMLTQLPG